MPGGYRFVQDVPEVVRELETVRTISRERCPAEGRAILDQPGAGRRQQLQRGALGVAAHRDAGLGDARRPQAHVAIRRAERRARGHTAAARTFDAGCGEAKCARAVEIELAPARKMRDARLRPAVEPQLDPGAELREDREPPAGAADRPAL